ncbi:MAG: M15 family metallopeptidase [Solirubrobacterales bacterium]|nr:M15 family metallopeptidase [Solirubrobacterales bacterium]
MLVVLAAVAVMLALAAPFESSVKPLPAGVRAQLEEVRVWRSGCPVALSSLRLLTVTHWDFDGKRQTGQLVVNKAVARPLGRVFHKLYRLHFPIRHLSIEDAYGPPQERPTDGDVSGSFECRPAAPSPCARGRGTGSWSNHAYGLAVDLNPRENPYVGCGQSHDPRAKRYRDRRIHRRGMVTRRVVEAFRSVGWGWGGSWTGDTKDYMHFSTTGH